MRGKTYLAFVTVVMIAALLAGLGCQGAAPAAAPATQAPSPGGQATAAPAVTQAPATAQPATKDPIKIGVLVNMGSPIGKTANQAVLLAVKKLNNAGGVLGRTIEVIEADSKGQVPLAVAEYRRLVMTDKVVLVVTAEGGTVTLACEQAGGEMYPEFPHIMMNASASAADIPKLTADDYDTYKFQFTLYTTGPDRFTWAGMVHSYLINHQIKPKPTKVAIIGEDLMDYNPYWEGWPEYGFRPYADVVYKDRGIEVVYTSKIAVGEKMFLPIFENIAASGAEYIDFAMSAYSDFYVLAKQWATSSAKDIPFFHSGVSPKYWDTTDGACLGMMGWWPSDYLDYEIVGKTKEYLTSFNETYGYPGSNWMAQAAYDDILFWVEGVNKAGTFETEAVIKALETVEFEGVRGVQKVNPVDHCSHNYPYKPGFVEALVKAVSEAPYSGISEALNKVHEEFGMFPYGIYPNGPLSPIGQWQNDGKLLLLWPPESVEKYTPGQGHIMPKDLRDKQR